MRASLSFVRWANSSLVYISGYWVRSNAFSSSSNWYAVKVVRDLLCFLLSWIPGSASISESPSPSPTAVRSSCFTIKREYFKAMIDILQNYMDLLYAVWSTSSIRFVVLTYLFFVFFSSAKYSGYCANTGHRCFITKTLFDKTISNFPGIHGL